MLLTEYSLIYMVYKKDIRQNSDVIIEITE